MILYVVLYKTDILKSFWEGANKKGIKYVYMYIDY